jgi:hypothetical protein
MGGTGPSAGPPALKRLWRFPEALAVGDGEDVVVAVGEAVVVVVVGAGEGEDGVVIPGMVVVCCASTMGGASHAARSANPAVKTARATIDNFNKARVRSVISPCASLFNGETMASLPALRHKRPRTGCGRGTDIRHLAYKELATWPMCSPRSSLILLPRRNT